MKTTNHYCAKYPQYAKTPKAVIAAVAFSLAQRICNDSAAEAALLLSDEWDALYVTTVVSQKRPAKKQKP